MNNQAALAPFPVPSPALAGQAVFAPGTVLQGTYRIVRPLAEGGCGEVYLADHTRLPGQFAIKVLHRGLARNAEVLARFRQEAEITSTLRHPHIVQVLDFNVTDRGNPYLVMELLEGKSLSLRVAEAGALEPATAVRIVEQIAQALHAAHVRGIVHRDLKPDNVMLLQADGVEDFVKVLDFGISQASWRPRVTDGAHVAGTPQYMAPEQACGLRDVIDARTDQFSLAAIAYTLLSGREPFTADDPIAVLYQVVHADPPVPSAIRPALGPAVDAVVMQGLAKHPDQRFPDVLSFAAALRDAVEGVVEVDVDDSAARDDAPPVRTAEFAPAELTFNPAALPEAVEPEVAAPGPQTLRLIRKVRWRVNRVPLRLTVAALAAAVALVWFSPSSRATAQMVWRQAEARAQHLVVTHLPHAGSERQR